MNRWVLSGAVLSMLLTGCDKKGKIYRPTTQELRLNLHSEPPTIDPRKATDTVSISVLKMCFEGLTRIDPTGQPIPAAAERIEISEDYKRYTFFLRDAKWSDGNPVTAYDFEKTWKEILDPAFPCEFAIDLYLLKNGRAAKSQRCSLDEVGVRALEERTLQVDLEHPVPYFLSALSTHAFFATPHHITSQHPHWTQDHYVGNGPFVLQQWRHHDSIIMIKNPHYWDKENIKLERIFYTLIEDETTELTMFENGELDWAGYPLSNLPTESLSSLSKKGSLQKYDIAGTYYYIFNTKEFPFTNVNIRKAFSLAINRRAIVENVTQMGQIPAMSLIPPTMWKNPHEPIAKLPAPEKENKTWQQSGKIAEKSDFAGIGSFAIGSHPYFHDNDIAEAKKLFALGLKELGITAEAFPPITLSYNTLVGHHKIAQAIQEQWHQAFGIRVKLENKEWKVFLDELRHHKFQVARMGGLANINDPSNFLDFYRYLSSSNNHSQWNNPKYSELLEEADLTIDADHRIRLLKQAEQVLMDDMPIAPIYFYTGVYVKKPYVKGIYLSELNDLDLKWAYVELDDQLSR
jgi:oligopeptide transport system substrate-binding protein